MNVDFLRDFAIAATNFPGGTGNKGYVWGLRGSATGPLPGFSGELFHASGPDNGDRIGISMVGGFDCNLDDYPDFAIGSPYVTR